LSWPRKLSGFHTLYWRKEHWTSLSTTTQVQWIHSYLSDRSQVVAVGGELSISRKVVSRVPQGSVLGPLLFTIYIYEI
jgi:hypothetical protein